MSMSKKDYEMVAETLAAVYAEALHIEGHSQRAAGIKSSLEGLSDRFSKDNKPFQPETFAQHFKDATKIIVAAKTMRVNQR